VQESFLFFINLLSVVRLYPSISVRRSAGYKAHLKLMVDIYPSQTEDGWHALIIFFISKPLNLKTFHPLYHFRHISVSFQLFLMKIAPLESSRYPLFNRIKRCYPLGRLGWRERSQSLIQSPPILLPPFLSYLSEFLVVFHENCTIGKHTLRSIKPHKATLSIRQSLLRRALSKSLILSPPSFCHISVSF
jgi:hypothetical protein